VLPHEILGRILNHSASDLHTQFIQHTLVGCRIWLAHKIEERMSKIRRMLSDAERLENTLRHARVASS